MSCLEVLALIILAQSEDSFPWWVPLIFVGGWLVVCFFISRLGWAAFVQAYGGVPSPPGTAFVSPATSFGSILASYKNVVRVVPCEVGIYFYSMFLFRVFHPPFLVPWKSVKKIELVKGWFSRGYRVSVEDPVGTISIYLDKRAGEVLSQYHPGLMTDEI